MYAVISTGGKQFRVKEGQRINVEKLNSEPGDIVSFDQVLMLGEGADVHIGNPIVPAAKVTAEVIEHKRDKKIKIVKLKRRKHHMKRMGHRQNYTTIEITAITSEN